MHQYKTVNASPPTAAVRNGCPDDQPSCMLVILQQVAAGVQPRT